MSKQQMGNLKVSKEKGYLIVASTNRFYYISAINLISSIKEFDPDTPVCLVVEERFLDKAADIADDILPCHDHRRAKIWGMAQSPYQKTFYIDADCEVVHEDIKTVFDKFDGNDILWSSLTDERSYIYKEYKWGSQGNKFHYCGGVCLYDLTKPLVKEFLEEWYDLTVEQYAGRWWPENEKGELDFDVYPDSLRRWDQFSLWWLLNKEPKYNDLKHSVLDNEYDARWNYYFCYNRDHMLGKDPIIVHYSNAEPKLEYFA